MEECNTGITIVKTIEECDGNYTSTNCIATPNAITYLDLSAGASQTQINANIVSALMRKDEQISEIPIANGSETKIIAGTNVTVTGTGTNTTPYVISAISNTGSLEFNIIDRTVWNNGKADIETNTTFGELSLSSNTTGNKNVSIGDRSMMFNTQGVENVSIGSSSMSSNTTGDLNVSIGADAMFRNTTGYANVAVGWSAFFNNTIGYNNTAIGFNPLGANTTGYNNTAIGYRALSNITTGNTNTAIGNSAGAIAQGLVSNTGAIESVYIGANTSPLNNNQTNQIVIGYGALGAGSNTVTLGNESIEKTILRGTINIGNLLVFEDNTLAIAGGLLVGDMYRTSTGDLKVRF